MDQVRTELLGQFTHERAELVVAALAEAGIVVWTKRSGALASLLFAGDWGTRVFVDASRRAEAEALASQVLRTAED